MSQTNFRLPEQNAVIVAGRLTRDPELRRTGTGKAVCSFDIAVSRKVKDIITNEWRDVDPTFVPIVVWGDQAERCDNKLKKGNPVYIEGRLQTNKWETSDGSKRSRLEVIALRVQFLFIPNKQESAILNVKRADVVDSNNNCVNDFLEQVNDNNSSDDDVPF
ncbi:MAG: single-stranded DNA-binding protein [Endomicrobium sp.]|jgi:single-strand DNA-binding protein|nr:single-stranded DNA-binding protein [Endomicrobium sp.]